jgi:hypothetical protein
VPDSPHTLEVRATSFGDEPTTVTLEVTPRSARWRAGRAGPFLAGALLLAPMALFPPHAPWALGAAGAAFFAFRKWRERVTLTDMDGPCPHCGEELRLAGHTALRSPHTLDCDSCHHHVTLHAPSEE